MVISKTKDQLRGLAILETRAINNNSVYSQIGFSKSLEYEDLPIELQEYYEMCLQANLSVSDMIYNQVNANVKEALHDN